MQKNVSYSLYQAEKQAEIVIILILEKKQHFLSGSDFLKFCIITVCQFSIICQCFHSDVYNSLIGMFYNNL